MPTAILPAAAPAERLSMADLGQRVRTERISRGFSLKLLSERSGVSRSMLSAVERGSKAPTVLVLDRIATGLDTSIARLLGPEQSSRVVLLRAADQDVARDPSGWERRILSPVLPGIEFELMRTTLAPGVDAGVFAPHTAGSREYVAVESGRLMLTLDSIPYLLDAGDSVYYDGDCEHAFANPGDTQCVYYLAMDVGGHRLAGRTRPAHSFAGTGRGPKLMRNDSSEPAPPPRRRRRPLKRRRLAIVSDSP
jgi:XRE family transcriptional regulator, regulator of sulfur utilization